jgi:hypothetical protein
MSVHHFVFCHFYYPFGSSGNYWSYLAKSSGGGNGPEKVCCSLIIAVLTFLLGCGLFVFFISIPYVVSYITPIGIDSIRITDALLFLCIFFYRVGSQREERQESLPEQVEQVFFIARFIAVIFPLQNKHIYMSKEQI